MRDCSPGPAASRYAVVVLTAWTGPMQHRSLPDLLTVTAIALVAYAASNVSHEAVGHGAACVALGGKPNVLSSVHFDCSEEAISALARRGVAAAGTIVNFIAGAIGLVALKATNPVRKPHISYFLWLTQFTRGSKRSAEPAELERSYAWIVAGCIASVIFVGILGPGIHF